MTTLNKFFSELRQMVYSYFFMGSHSSIMHLPVVVGPKAIRSIIFLLSRERSAWTAKGSLTFEWMRWEKRWSWMLQIHSGGYPWMHSKQVPFITFVTPPRVSHSFSLVLQRVKATQLSSGRVSQKIKPSLLLGYHKSCRSIKSSIHFKATKKIYFHHHLYL